MIRRIELTDFEIHRHTVIDNLTDGLNLIVGDSNCGKTSIIRAIKLAAYNEFDAACVRIGASKCVVRIDTDKGYVKVSRGPRTNEWECCRNGEQPVSFTKVGKNIVPMAAEIMGLKMVTLGDVEFPVNVMGQLESHFMLAGIGDKNATGSMRAQIIDEISGLSGFEPLVKEVAADGIRFAREKNELDEKVKEVEKDIIDDSVLESKKVELENAEALLEKYHKCVSLIAEAKRMYDGGLTIRHEFDRATERLATLPDASMAIKILHEAYGSAGEATELKSIIERVGKAQSAISDKQGALAKLPDAGGIKEDLVSVEESCRNATEMERMLRSFESKSSILENGRNRLGSLPKVDGLSNGLDLAKRRYEAYVQLKGFLDKYRVIDGEIRKRKNRSFPDIGNASAYVSKAEKIIELEKSASDFNDKFRKLSTLLETRKTEFDNLGKRLAESEKELSALIADVKVCPLTMKPCPCTNVG